MVLAGEQTTLVSAPARARLSVRTLGGFAITREGRWMRDEEWGRPAASRLVRFLLVNGGSASEEDVIDALWRNLSSRGARRSLQVAASLARKVLDREGAEESVVAAEAGAYRLRLGPSDRVDAVEFDAAAADALRARGGSRVELLEAARRRWTGEPLPGDRESPWAEAWRGLLCDRYEAVLAELLDVRLGHGQDGEVLALARQMLSRAPLNERAHRALIVAYARLGRRDLALEQYRRCHELLTGELGIEPSGETLDLQRRALAGDPV